MSALPARRLPHSDGLPPCRHALSASGDGPCVPSWTRQLKAANEAYAALNAKYLETDGAKQFIAKQQTAIAAAAERKMTKHGGRRCVHDRQTNRCKECGGSQVCPHGKLRSS